MAGSFYMAVTDISLLENVGDCIEAMEEMIWVIDFFIGRDAAKFFIENKFRADGDGDTGRWKAYWTKYLESCGL